MLIVIFMTGVVVIIIYYRHNITEGYKYVGRQTASIRSQYVNLPTHFKEILDKYFDYYIRLSPENKRKFEQKLVYTLLSKQFIPRSFDKVTDEMKVMISASIVQLTFGFPQILLAHFNKILVYPNDYYSSITKQHHKGEVNPAFGMVVLSWKSFMDGYFQGEDSINLGLHEMAHALRLEAMIRKEEGGYFDSDIIQRLDEWGDRVCQQMEANEQKFFRPYACTNKHEFFAVAVENFFERSVEFKSEIPELYEILTKLLQQDPILLNSK